MGQVSITYLRYIASTSNETRFILKSLIFGLFCLLISTPLLAEPYSYLSTVAQAGDGMYALLRRYDLPVNSCYTNKFRNLNSLSEKQVLLVGQEYKLPILVYSYNEKSIRTTLGIKDLALAKKIQAYNRARETAGQQQQPYEKSLSLWVPYGILFCESEEGGANWKDPEEIRLNVPSPANTAPAEATPEAIAVRQNSTENESSGSSNGYVLFGEAYKNVELIDKSLEGKVFYLVSGHGGPDPGAMGEKRGNILCEDEYAYDVVLRLARNIVQRGGVPYLIVRDKNDGIRDDEFLDCDYDEVVWGDLEMPRDQRLRLKQRSDVINDLAKTAKKNGVQDQYCIVVHVDSRHEETQTDLFFYHQKNSPKSEALTLELRNTMDRNYKRNGRQREYAGLVLTRDLHMLREVEVPTVYIELGNIQHAFDQKRVLQASNRQALANWWTEGIIRALK